MAELHYLPQTEFKRIAGLQVDADLKHSLLTDMVQLNALSICSVDGFNHRELVRDFYEKLTALAWPDRASSERGETQLIIETEEDNPALRALDYARGAAPALLPDSDDSQASGDISTSPKITAVAPGSAIPYALGVALADKARGASRKIVVLLASDSHWQTQLFDPSIRGYCETLDGLTFIAQLPKESDASQKLIRTLPLVGWQTRVYEKLDANFSEQSGGFDGCNLVLLTGYANENSAENEVQLFSASEEMQTPNSLKARYTALCDKLDITLARADLPALEFAVLDIEETLQPRKSEAMVDAFGKVLLQAAGEHDEIVFFDSMPSPTRAGRRFAALYPDRCIRNRNVQEVIPMAQGMADAGMIPVIAFSGAESLTLTSQDHSRIVFAHIEETRDKSSGECGNLQVVPVQGFEQGLTIYPSCDAEAISASQFALEETKQNCLLCLSTTPPDPSFDLPKDYFFVEGRGSVVRGGKDALLFTYGPELLQRALAAGKLLEQHDFDLCIVNMPWLNQIDFRWVRPLLSPFEQVHVVEDRTAGGGMADYLMHECSKHNLLQRRQFIIHGPSSSTPDGESNSDPQIYHDLAPEAIAADILKTAGERRLSISALHAARKLRTKIDERNAEESVSAMLAQELELLKSI
jgi:transketolase C-terminal domain/subunit